MGATANAPLGTDNTKDQTGTTTVEPDEEQYPSLRVVIPTSLCLYLAVFLVALDRTIIGVAIPKISDEFHSFGDISWYEAGFLLTLCVFQLLMGKLYKYFSAKWTLVTFVSVFEIGSIVCAAAPSSAALIVGRAITGLGAAGVVVGALLNISNLVPLRKKAKYQGFVGACFGISSILGPLVGGAFTSDLTWRWCFWINLPIGGCALAGLVIILPSTSPPEQLHGTMREKLKQFDPIGNILLASGVVCLLFALQWGGTKYSWSNHRIIILLVLGSLLLLAFAAFQYWMKEDATVPPRIVRQRSILSATLNSFCLGATLILASFYLPIYFQAIKGTSAGTAGVRLLPYFLSTVTFVIGSGILVSKLGYYTPFLIVGCAILIVGTGLLTTLSPNTSTGEWVGYTILVGAGIGLSLQQPANAAQTVLAKGDVPTGLALNQFFNSFGGTIFVSVAQTVLSNTLASRLSTILPGFDAASISSAGATDIRKLVPKDKLAAVLTAYNAGIDNVYYCALATSCLALAAASFMEWRSMRTKSQATESHEMQGQTPAKSDGAEQV